LVNTQHETQHPDRHTLARASERDDDDDGGGARIKVCDDMDDRRAHAATPLLRRDGDARRQGTTVRKVIIGACASASVLGVAALTPAGKNFSSALREKFTPWRACDDCPLLAPDPTGTQGAVTFKLHTYCKTDATKQSHGEFFLTGSKEAYVVRHNFGGSKFFDINDGIKMDRVKFGGGEWGYQVTTNQVDFEWGFALKNEDGDSDADVLMEIGKSDSLLAYENCTQRYGKYFNRVMTLETGSKREFVFGSCDDVCPADYVDTAYARYLGDSGETIPSCSSGNTYDFGAASDARSLSLITAVLTKGGDHNAKFGRQAAFRDKSFQETKQQTRWLIAGTEGIDRSMIKIAYITATLTNGRLLGCQSATKKIMFPGGACSKSGCSPLSYDMSIKARDEADEYDATLDVSAPLFTLGQAGDSVPKEYFKAFTYGAYLKTYTMHEAGTWGSDMDVRRIIINGGSTCGSSSYKGNCVGTYSAFIDTTKTNTATSQYWVMAALVGDNETIKMMQLRVYLQNGAVKVEALRRAWKNDNGFQGKQGETRSGFEYDAFRDDIDIPKFFAKNDGSAASGYDVGSLKWLLAPEMLPTLEKMTEIHSIARP